MDYETLQPFDGYDDARETARCERLHAAGRLCCACLGEFEPDELETIDLDPGDPEVGPDPDIIRLCVDCAASYHDPEEAAR